MHNILSYAITKKGGMSNIRNSLKTEDTIYFEDRFLYVKFIRKVSDFEQKKKQIDSNIESAQNVILSNCTKPRTGQLKNIGIWG